VPSTLLKKKIKNIPFLLSSKLVQKIIKQELITKFRAFTNPTVSNKMNKDDKTYSILVVEDNLIDSNRIEQLLMQLDFDLEIRYAKKLRRSIRDFVF
jgi:PleD family two-component response regulator